ncbi:MAG: hypothetical protein AB8G23_17975 [Myxococcota bacterium]
MLSLRLVLVLAAALSSPAEAQAQTVAMSGEYGESSGRVVNLPLNPPFLPCAQAQNARCHAGQLSFVGGTSVTDDPLAEPSSGVGVPGAGVRVIDGGLGVGDAFTVPTGAFKQDAGLQFTPIVNQTRIHQLNTTFTYSMPAAARAVNPPAATRIFQPNAWNAPGNGQTGRGAASTTPISTATQTEHEITVRYKSGLNAFGGTMAALRDGEGRLFLAEPPFLGTGSTYNTETRPWVGTNQLGDGIPNNPNTRIGAGWGYTRMHALAPSVIKNLAGVAPPCTAATPPAPAGCGLVTDFTGFTIGIIPGATTTQHLFAWTTGTVEVLLAETIGGFAANQLLTAMGYDTTSMTLSGGTVRNIGMVAGSFTKRTSSGFTRSGAQIVGLDMRFTPEPAATAALVIGVGGLALLMKGRASEGRR